LTYEKVLSEESVHLREIKKNSHLKLPAGIHRFPFAFIVPNVNKRQKKKKKKKREREFFFLYNPYFCHL
jgi:hypothetical protein